MTKPQQDSESSSNSRSLFPDGRSLSPLAHIIRFFLYRKLVVGVFLVGLVFWGISVAPFDWKIDWLPRDPVPVDAIPNLGENQQIVFAEWEGRSPQDVEDQVTYPLTVSLLGLPGVQEIRSQSGFGFSMIFLIFEEDVEFYWSRARIVEKLNSLPAGLLPAEVHPTLGPDATGLGQIYWYTLEGRDPDGNPAGGWDLGELRSVQDWHVRYALQAAEGISEVASIGGFVPEYQVEVNRDAMRVLDVGLEEIVQAVGRSNLDVGAGVTEINRVEYIIRGRGFVKSLDDLEEVVVRVGEDSVPIRIRDVAVVNRGPGPRRGALAVGGAEAVGGVVVVRNGYNPLVAIQNVQEKIAEISAGLPIRAVIDWEKTDLDAVKRFSEERGFGAFDSAELDQDAWLAWLRANPRDVWPQWITTSQIEIVPFYNRAGLIQETLATLNDAIFLQILVTVIVVIVMIMHLRTALVISSMLPLAVLFAFIAMKLFGVDANLVSLAGIAIAIGTIIDLGIIIVENILKHLKVASADEPTIEVVFRGTREVGSAVLAAVATTVVSFLPVFTMTGAEGKMFIPLAFTKTFAIVGSVVIALIVVPAATEILIAERVKLARLGRGVLWGLGLLAIFAVFTGTVKASLAVVFAGLLLLGMVLYRLFADRIGGVVVGLAGFETAMKRLHFSGRVLGSLVAAALVLWLLAVAWEPLGPERGFFRNLIFVGLLIGVLTGVFLLLARVYGTVLRWCLANKALFLSIPAVIVLMGTFVWLGFDRVLTFVPRAVDSIGFEGEKIRSSQLWISATHLFPGLGREFMPPLDEGTFLLMPTTMPHASIGEVLDVLKYQNKAISGIPEIDTVVGKIGRADSALDPAPVSMLETIINYKSEYITDESGRRINFRYDSRSDEFLRDEEGDLIPDRRGRPFRQWRDQIRTPDDIWSEIVRVAKIPGTTSAPKLQPIETRLVMLQTGMSAPMGVKIRAPDLETLDQISLEIERFLREVPVIESATVNADRVVGMPYLEIEIDREAIARHGLRIEDVQDVLSTAIGGRVVTETVEGRERYPVRVRYQRELRDGIEDLENVLVKSVDGRQIPLTQLADIQYVRGPETIQSEDTFLTAYVTFGGIKGVAEVDVVESAEAFLDARIEAGDLVVPTGVSWRFAGNYENQMAAASTLRVVLPIALAIIFLILFFQFKSLATTLIVFSSIAVAWSGGFIMFWFYGQPWFLDFPVFGVNMRELFQLNPINLSVAVWVGFLALFGIASDDAVVMATYLDQQKQPDKNLSVEKIRARILKGALRRIRPCLMTAATTILALLPILTSTGTGSEIMIPMALPSFGGMIFVLLSLFTTPVLYSWVEERRLGQAREEI